MHRAPFPGLDGAVPGRDRRPRGGLVDADQRRRRGPTAPTPIGTAVEVALGRRRRRAHVCRPSAPSHRRGDERRHRRRPQRQALRPIATAVVRRATGRSPSPQLDERTNRLANVLLERYGIGRGDRVALLVPNRLEVLEVLGGCAKAGAVYCGLNFRLGEEEYEAIFENAEPRLLITERRVRRAGGAARASASAMPVVDARRRLRGAAARRVRRRCPRDAARGAARGRLLHRLHERHDRPAEGRAVRPPGRRCSTRLVAALEYELDARSRWLMALPHNSSVQITLLPLLLVGGATGFSDSRGFDAAAFARGGAAHPATHTYLVPTMLFRVLEAGHRRARTSPTLHDDRLRRRRRSRPSGSPSCVQRFGPIFTQLYGMAEVASIGTMLRKDDHARALAGDAAAARLGGPPGPTRWTCASSTTDGRDVAARRARRGRLRQPAHDEGLLPRPGAHGRRR